LKWMMIDVFSEVSDLVDELRVVNERVAVVLPVEVDLDVAVHFNIRDGVVLVPVAHVSLHAGRHIPFIIAGTFAACPLFPVGYREIEVRAGKISFKSVGSLEAVSHRRICLTFTDFRAIGAGVGLGS